MSAIDLFEVSEWARETFGPVEPIRAVVRANEEMAELLKAACCATSEADLEKMAEEAADVVIVLCHLAGALHIDLGWAIEKKMVTNRLRKWRVDGDGTGYHIDAALTEPESSDSAPEAERSEAAPAPK